MKIFAAHNVDSEIRRKSSAGGVFSLIAEDFIQSGGVVFGVGFDELWNPAHICIKTIDKLSIIRGSKYVFSTNYSEAINEALKYLDEGKKVLFSGTPCQIAAIKHRSKNHHNLTTVEIVCHGAPEEKYWKEYLKELTKKLCHEIEDIRSINFRDKRVGWKNYNFTIEFNNGEEFSENHDDNLYMRAFLHNYILRKPCFHCQFKYPEGNHADITLGDLWGISQMAPSIDNNLGTTLVIARTPKGEKAIKDIKVDAIVSFDSVKKYNPAIYTSPKKPSDIESFCNVIEKRSIIRTFKKFAGRPLKERIMIKASKVKRLIFESLKLNK